MNLSVDMICDVAFTRISRSREFTKFKKLFKNYKYFMNLKYYESKVLVEYILIKL